MVQYKVKRFWRVGPCRSQPWQKRGTAKQPLPWLLSAKVESPRSWQKLGMQAWHQSLGALREQHTLWEFKVQGCWLDLQGLGLAI